MNMAGKLVVSDEVIAQAGIDRFLFEWRRSELRGKRKALLVAPVPKASDLPTPEAETNRAGAIPAT